MSEASVAARKAMKEKAHRMATGDPHQKVDASSWTPPEPMETQAPTGPRPVSKRRNYRAGGHVEGEKARHHAGRKPRKAGGRNIADELLNADVKEANESREGIKHEGGMKRGGRAHRAVGGGSELAGLLPGGLPNQGGVPPTRFNFQNGPSLASKSMGLKRGGKAEHPEGCRCADCMGGRVERAEGGEVSHPLSNLGQFAHPAGGREPRADGGAADRAPSHYEIVNHKTGNSVARALSLKGARRMVDSRDNQYGASVHTYHPVYRQPEARGGKLNTKERDALPKREFGEPGSRKYPMPDKSHAANAKARASQQEHKGHISKSTEEKINAKADRVLHRAKGGAAGKGKMSVNIIIAPGGQHPQAPAPPMAAGPPMPPPRPPMPPPGLPPGGPPPGMAGPPGLPPGMPMRKRGGLVEGGAGGGLGRLEKVKDYGDRAWDAEERR